MRAPAPAKINLALVVGPARDDGKHEVVTLLQRVDLADRVAVAPSTALTVTGFTGDTIVREALTRLGDAAGVEPRWSATITKRIPVAAGLGGGSSDAATALRLSRRTLERPLSPDELDVAATLGADVPFFLGDGPQLGRGDGSTLEPIDLPQDYWVVLILPNGAAKASTAAVYTGFDERNGAKGWDGRRSLLEAVLPGIQRPRDLTALPPNDLASSPLADALLPARRLPRRRQRRRADGLRALPPPPAGGGGAPRASAHRHDLADRAGLVRLARATVPAWNAH